MDFDIRLNRRTIKMEMNIKQFKYVMIITEENEISTDAEGRYVLTYFSENPWDGDLVSIIYGDTVDELYDSGDYEGLFFQLFETKDGSRITYGIFDPDSPREDIEEFEEREAH